MAKNPNDADTLFQRLTRLFKSGPLVKRKIKDFKAPSASTALDLFRKTQRHAYSNIINAYGQYDRAARYSDGSEMEYCLSADTLIAVPDGYKTIKALADEYGLDKEFIVYSYDHNKRQIVPAFAKQARKTRTDMAFKVTFDSGKTIIGTPNHRLMLRDGTYKKIEELVPGDSMMPFYRKDVWWSNQDSGDGYRAIYTMNHDLRSNGKKRTGWTSEHRLIAEWSNDREVLEGEVVHHKNFKKYDNRPENLQIMHHSDHERYHAEILNGKKWAPENNEWIQKFKAQHSRWMLENNPAQRKDITFGKILEKCEQIGFNLYHVSDAFDTDPNVIKRHLEKNGFKDFVTFAQAYSPGWKSDSWNNSGKKNPRFNHDVTFQKICENFSHKMTLKEMSKKLCVSSTVIHNRVCAEGYKNFAQFKESFENHKVISIEEYGIIDLYDLTVDGYKNFATDTVISHNTPEIAAALDIYADESCSQDEKGRSLHIHSDDVKIRRLLEELFYDTLNVEFNLRSWTRNLCKYGDFFLFNDVSPDYGIINAFPIAVNEVEREEGYDPEDPLAFRFRWVTQGNQILENWQLTHFRLLGNDAFLPYGSSVIEPA